MPIELPGYSIRIRRNDFEIYLIFIILISSNDMEIFERGCAGYPPIVACRFSCYVYISGMSGALSFSYFVLSNVDVSTKPYFYRDD